MATTKRDLTGVTPETWRCIDCGINTAPGLPTRVEAEKILNDGLKLEKLTGKKASIPMTYTDACEVYMVRDAVWKAAGMDPWGGCLCIGCLEQRIGRRLRPKDFPRHHPFNRALPGTPRLMERQGRDIAAAFLEVENAIEDVLT